MKPVLMLAAMATSALLLVPTVAVAQTVAISATVPVDDLDATVTADRAKLDARVTRAIGKLCAEPGMRGADRRAMENYCIANTQASATSSQLALNVKRRPARRLYGL